MGNQLVGIAPSQIYPVEHYFAGALESDLQFESRMGSTRFFKVARARCEEGLVVVKVFVRHDPTLPLEAYAERVEIIKKCLANAVNCLPFQRVLLTERAGFIMRQYVKHSLYDRVSTRPFLTVLEKKWITFQILCALNQCHKQKVCHGDIKLENILITSWNWILLSDFASFKPTYLPEDNPADFNYFFDTSRRRFCYIAPERFVKTLSSDGAHGKDVPLMSDSTIPGESFMRDGQYSGNLLPEMDIFSAGCSLLELWTEGTAPFELSQLLAYRRGEQELLTQHLLGIENENLRSLMLSMLNRNPKERKTAEIYLDQERGRLFPEYFYSFLQSYLQMFSSSTIMSPDDKIMRLHSDISHFIIVLTQKDEQENSSECSEKTTCDSNSNISENDGLILIITVVTSCIRGLQYCNSKISCLEMLQKLASYASSETILDRILPYILHLCEDTTKRVRVAALDTLTACLALVKDVPCTNANVFPEYILPAISPLATDNATIVRVAYARNIAKLAETSVYFLEQIQLKHPNEMPATGYETELKILHDMMQITILSLFTDSQPVVKQTLIEFGITKLCVFFGKQKANDVILSHMITFLNDKEDKNLRGSFFDCIVGVVAYVGWQSSDILMPLLQQGLSDSEELVIMKSIRATTSLIELGLIQKPALTEFISESACYLTHPNIWIRHEICGLISTAAKTLAPIDVQCKIMPAISNNFRAPVIQIEKTEILLDNLNPPIPRNIFDSVIKFPEIFQLIRVLEDRKEARKAAGEGIVPQYADMGTALKNLFRRLTSDGLTDFIELQLLSMKSFLVKLSKYKSQEPKNEPDGRILVSRSEVKCDVFPLVTSHSKSDAHGKKGRRSDAEGNSNSEWQHIFGSNEAHSPIPSSPSNDSCSAIVSGTPPSGAQIQPTPSSSLVEYSMPDRSFLQERASECQVNLEKYINKLRTRYAVLAASRDFNPATYFAPIPHGWRMNGTLVAHLHEHKASVTKLTPMKPYSPLFASGSLDGTVRLWDCNRLNGKQSINRSRQVYTASTPICSLTACDAGQSLAVGEKDGTLLILKIDRHSTKMSLQHALNLVDNSAPEGTREDGPIVDMHPLDDLSQSVIIYATLYGGIVAWDLRTQTAIWRLQNDLRSGVITTFCVDPTGSWLVVGTSSGKHICWDLRFRLAIAEIRHPDGSWIRKVTPHPTEQSWFVSASQGNNEVSIWNIETGHRQMALWASTAPALTTRNSNPSTTCALLPGIVDGSPFLLTGSSDQRIRYWDLGTPRNSSLIVPSSKDNLTDNSFSYEDRLIDGTRVISETITNLNTTGCNSNRNSEEQPPRSGPELPSSSHIDCITDFLMCKVDKQQTFMVSSGRDGVIKLWK